MWIVLGSSWHFVIRSYCSAFLRRAALESGRCSTWPSSPDMEAGHSNVLLTSPVQPQTASALSSCVVIPNLAFAFCPPWGKHIWSREVSALRSGERQVLEGNVGSTAQSPPKYLISHGTGYKVRGGSGNRCFYLLPGPWWRAHENHISDSIGWLASMCYSSIFNRLGFSPLLINSAMFSAMNIKEY